MIYWVKAKYIEEKMPELYKKLSDGSILKQEPDGKEIFASMKRAKITAPGVVQWCEKDFCPTPLENERKTVYDLYFSEFETTPVEDYLTFKGKSFWNFIKSKS
jgi:hypothetical protein